MHPLPRLLAGFFMNRFLLFYSDLESTSSLIEGRLLLINADDQSISNVYLSTSGQPGYQTNDGSNIPGRGTIPRQENAGIPHYTVSTTPLDRKGVPGIDGKFYLITPSLVTLADGTVRGDFGIHLDANGIDGLKRIGGYSPGSAGCCVLRSLKGWEAFQRDMRSLADAGIENISFLVSYA